MNAKSEILSLFQLRLITVMLVLLMGIWGCLGIYNATVFSEAPFYFAGKQLLWLFTGIIILFITASTPFKKINDNALYLCAGAYCAIILLFAAGVRINGMKGWFDLHYFYIQPSEIAKPFFILSLCKISDYTARKKLSDAKRFLILSGVTLLWIIPIVLEPDFGTVLVYAAGFVIVYYITDGRFSYLAFLAFLFIISAVVIVMTEPYVAARIKGFLYPEQTSAGAGWHTLQLQYTMARGGLTGQNWGHSLWSNSFLPLPYSDSAFASLVEAIGFLGTLPVIASFCILTYTGCMLGLKTETNLNRTFILSVTYLITFQALLHISVNVTMLPATGITLPLFSYGGSSMLATMLSIGLMLSAAGRNNFQQ